MRQPVSLKRWLRLKTTQTATNSQLTDNSNSGFTLIEMIAVVLIIAALSAIIAPGWLAFVNRQRVAKVNDGIWTALQEAQREAKRTKRSYNVSFRQNVDVPEVAVYQAEDDEGTAISLNSTSNAWQPLSQDLEIKDGQVILCSNLDQANTSTNAGSISCNLSAPRTITFNYQGNLEDDANLGSTAPNVLAVTVAIPNSTNQAIPATARCVTVKTLIGSMEIGKGEYNATSNPQGCPL
mgnify:CR=1 FL=1